MATPHAYSEVRRAERLLASADEKERWTGAELLGEFAEPAPELVWPIVSCFGCSESEDIRSAVATCILEHILEYHFERYFPETERLARGDVRFADTVSRCWAFGETELPHNRTRFDALIQSTQTIEPGDAADREQACRLRLEYLPSGPYAAWHAQRARGS